MIAAAAAGSGCAQRVGADAAVDAMDASAEGAIDAAVSMDGDVPDAPEARACVPFDGIAAEPLVRTELADAALDGCRWQPIGPVPDAGIATDVPIVRAPIAVDAVVSTTSGVWAAVRRVSDIGSYFWLQRFAFDGSPREVAGLGSCGCGTRLSLAVGHGVLYASWSLGDTLTPIADGWTAVPRWIPPFGVLAIISQCAGSSPYPSFLPLASPPSGGVINELTRAVFDDGSFLFVWTTGNSHGTSATALNAQRFSATGEPLATMQTPVRWDPTYVSSLTAVATRDGAACAWIEPSASPMMPTIRVATLTREGALRYGPSDAPGPALRSWYDPAGARVRLFHADDRLLVTWFADGGSASGSIVLRTLAIDGTPVGDPVLVPGIYGLPVARTPTGELLVGPDQALPIACLP